MPVSEIVLVAGPPGGGKSTYVKSLVASGYCRINRDDIGGDLGPHSQCYSILRTAHQFGEKSFVFDNVYATVESREVIIGVAQKMGLPIRIVWLDTTPEQAQFFAARRQVQRYGRILTEADYPILNKTDDNMFPPAAQFAYWKRVQPPTVEEGFTSVDHVPVKIDLGPGYVNKALIFDYDGTIRTTKSGFLYPRYPDDVVILPGRAEVLQRKVAEGWRLLGASNQSGISKTPGDEYYVSEGNAIAGFDRTNRLLGVDIEYLYAPDTPGAPQTFLRKPMAGMGVIFIEKYKLNPSACVYVGDMKTDETFAKRCGFQFVWSDTFFGSSEVS
jgi:HAD superfamily hydrolase (TIGR01662 family)